MIPTSSEFYPWLGTYPGKVLSVYQLGTLLSAYAPAEAFQKIVEAEIGPVGARLVAILSALTSTDAEVYVMGYYNALPDIPGGRELIEALNGAIRYAAGETGATYVPTMTAFDKNLYRYLPLVDSSYPYEGVTRDIHPTIQGYRAIAQSFWIPIQKDFLRD